LREGIIESMSLSELEDFHYNIGNFFKNSDSHEFLADYCRHHNKVVERISGSADDVLHLLCSNISSTSLDINPENVQKANDCIAAVEQILPLRPDVFKIKPGMLAQYYVLQARLFMYDKQSEAAELGLREAVRKWPWELEYSLFLHNELIRICLFLQKLEDVIALCNSVLTKNLGFSPPSYISFYQNSASKADLQKMVTELNAIDAEKFASKECKSAQLLFLESIIKSGLLACALTGDVKFRCFAIVQVRRIKYLFEQLFFPKSHFKRALII
jgi:hypothetical protein